MELFDVLNQDGSKTGIQKERKEVHKDGDLHGSVHIWLIKEGSVLLQKRAKDKDSYPGCFDVASSGHIDAGEDPITAAIREVREEISLSITKEELIPLFTQLLKVQQDTPTGKFISNEINYVYLLDHDVDILTLSYQESEIDGLVSIPMPELLTQLREQNADYCISLTECEKAFTYYANYNQLIHVRKYLAEKVTIFPFPVQPIFYVSEIIEPDFGCEGRPENETIYSVIKGYTCCGEQSISIEDSLFQSSSINTDMWIGKIENETNDYILYQEHSANYEIISDIIINKIKESLYF